MEYPGRTYAMIDLDAIAYNFQSMRKIMSPDAKMTAVIKADGYGHGAVPIAHLAEGYDYIWGFAAATPEEALELRRAGIRKPILILGFVFPEYFEEMIRNEIRLTVFDSRSALLLQEAAEKLQKTAYVHIAVDTGMTRIGVKDNSEGLSAALNIDHSGMLKIEGAFTHFARADETDKTKAWKQFERFTAFCDTMEAAGIRIPIRHCSNSAAIMELKNAHLDMVRAGITIYGIYPSDEVDRTKLPLKPAMSWKTRVSYVKEVEEGVEISYGGTFVTDHRMKVATIPVGYADGYPRLLSGKGSVLIHGKRAAILGRVCMDQFMVDVTAIDHVISGDEVTLLGTDGDECITVDELGALSGRFPYEFVCDVSKRVPRICKRNGEITRLD